MITLENSMKHLRIYGTKAFFVLFILGVAALPAYAQENLWKELNDKTTSLFKHRVGALCGSLTRSRMPF